MEGKLQTNTAHGDEAAWNEYQETAKRIKTLDAGGLPQPYAAFFAHLRNRLTTILDNADLVHTGAWTDQGIDFLHENNHAWYDELIDAYDASYANPSCAVNRFGGRTGRALCFLYAESVALYPLVMEQKWREVSEYFNLLLHLCDMGKAANPGLEWEQKLERALSEWMDAGRDSNYRNRVRETLDPDLSFAKDVVLTADLEDLAYLYRFGEPIYDNELRMAKHMNGLSREEVVAMARVFTEGYRRGFELNRVDLSKKKTVQIRYPIGMERMVREAIAQFGEMGLKAILPRNAVGKRQPVRGGYQAQRPYRQFLFDHQFDDALYLNRERVDGQLASLRAAYEECRGLATDYAGPAVIESFGEEPFSPAIREERLHYDEEKQELARDYQAKAGAVVNEYIKKEEYGFTIIAFPLPEIGEDFADIFRETLRLNSLDNESYQRMQQTLIDALDGGEYVKVTGRKSAGNLTDLKVCLAPLRDSERETRFENCLADVNIPLGEVFTTPRLTGTQGLLHVSKTYLKDLEYVDLKFWFQDGMVSDYQCANFDEEAKNRGYVKENVLYHYESLPMGEFAIGTNTVAYRMGRTYGISHKMPILITEKTGLHIAVGDSCYAMSEEVKVYNPDGKEVIARENERSVLRRTDWEKAYFYCHTDVTIPYDELGDVVVCHKDGSEAYLIRNGRFVLEGTEELNEPLDRLSK